MRRRRALALPGVLLIAWLLLSTPQGVTGLDLMAGLAAMGAGLLVGALWPRAHETADHALAVTEDLLGEARPEPGPTTGLAAAFGAGEETGAVREAGHADTEDGGVPGGDPDRLDPAEAPAALDSLLDRLTTRLGAHRILLWRVDPDADQVAPEHGPGPLPRTMPAKGSPLAWALRERSTLRLDPAPRWAQGSATAAAVDGARVMTVESPVGAPPDPGELAGASAILAAFLPLHDRQVDAAAALYRLERVTAFLRSVPREEDPSRMPHATAEAALAIAGGSGALIASWSDGQGQVLLRQGTGGGPAPGTAFATGDGDLAHAARARATVRRGPGDGRWPDLAGAEERWERPAPVHRVVVPLVDPRGDTTGLLAVWGRTALSDQGIELLEAIAPLLSLQLVQAGELERYRDQATIDALTGLPNRAALDEKLDHEAARFHRYRRPLAVLVADLDHFKRINDDLGHEAGDAVLRHVAEALRGAVREVDFAARFGGEELVVVLPETLLFPALEVAERVRAAIEAAPLMIGDTEVRVTASIGVSACPERVDDPAQLFTTADQALYASKAGGRNRVTAYEAAQQPIPPAD